MTSDTEEPDLIALYERRGALRVRLRIAQIHEFGMATDRTTSAMGLALRTDAPAWLAIELMELQFPDAEMLRQRVQNSEGTFLPIIFSTWMLPSCTLSTEFEGRCMVFPIL